MDNYEHVNNPKHYNTEGRYECIVEMIKMFGEQKVKDWCRLTAYKYYYRAGQKPENDREQDYAKAKWYLDAIDVIDGELKVNGEYYFGREF